MNKEKKGIKIENLASDYSIHLQFNFLNEKIHQIMLVIMIKIESRTEFVDIDNFGLYAEGN